MTAEKLPPKVLVVHRFTRDMVTGYKRIKLDPRVQIVMNMDGWGPPSLKRESYRAYVYKYPVEYTGFKLFYKNDTKKGDKLMSPADVLALKPDADLHPVPVAAAQSATTIVASCRTGKFTELAMKQPSCAFSCSACALSTSVPCATVTRGRSTTSVNRSLPSFTAITPCASSSYATTCTPARAQSAR